MMSNKDRWLNDIYGPFTNKRAERQPQFETLSHIPVEPLYTPEDSTFEYERDLAYPGEYPYTRGIYPTMYRGRLWTMRQYAGFSTAEESNARYKYLLARGTTGLSVAFDLPTQLGYDADDPMSRGEVGKVGVSISSLEDMEALFDGIPLDKVSTSMTINSPASILWAMYIAVGKKQGVAPAQLRGTIQNDILKEYLARGTYIYPPTPSMRLVTDTFAYANAELPKWNPISISGYHIREAGSTAVQEVAFTLANGLAYVEAALSTGMEIDEFAGGLAFFFNAHNNFLEEVAKFRAARRLWARLMRDRFGAQKPRSWMLRFHTQTAGSTLTAQQPENNMVRVALQALAAVLGGTQSLHTNSMDEALGLPTEKAVEIALRTQQVIAYESGIADTVDPLAGSYYIESLTNEIERQAADYINKIDQMGGALRAIEAGWMQAEIQNAAYDHQKAVERQEQVIVGLNRFVSGEEASIEIMKIDDSIGVQQAAKLAALRLRRNNEHVEQHLAAITEAATSDDNLMPHILNAVEAYATTGEICNTLRAVWGEHRPNVFV